LGRRDDAVVGVDGGAEFFLDVTDAFGGIKMSAAVLTIDRFFIVRCIQECWVF
jgi:hypothetical protein